MMDVALAFYADKAYLPGLNALLASLQAHGMPELPKILITRNAATGPICPARADPAIRADARFERIILSRAQDFAGVKYAPRFLHAWAKLELFRITDYDRIIYLDADCLCTGSLQDLCTADLGPGGFAAAPDWSGRESVTRAYQLRGINSGMMVIDRVLRSQQTFEQLVEIGRQGLAYDGGDQGAINRWLQDQSVPVCQLHPVYNLLKRVYFFDPRAWRRLATEVRVIHFVGAKPWQLQQHERDYEPLNEFWRQACRGDTPPVPLPVRRR